MSHSDSGADYNHSDDDDDDDDDGDGDRNGDCDDISPAVVTAVAATVLITVRRASWKQVSPSVRSL